MPEVFFPRWLIAKRGESLLLMSGLITGNELTFNKWPNNIIQSGIQEKWEQSGSSISMNNNWYCIGPLQPDKNISIEYYLLIWKVPHY